MTPILEFHDVVKSYGGGALEVRALTDVSLTIGAGEFVAVRGPSGCGKSTLLHLAGGLEDPSAGRVVFDGHDLHSLDAAARAELRRRHVGYVFQRLNLVPALTAVENVMLPLELDGMRGRAARVQAIEALGSVGLDHHLDRYPDDFSGGQQGSRRTGGTAAAWSRPPGFDRRGRHLDLRRPRIAGPRGARFDGRRGRRHRVDSHRSDRRHRHAVGRVGIGTSLRQSDGTDRGEAARTLAFCCAQPGRARAPRAVASVAPPEDLIAAMVAAVPSFRAIQTSVANIENAVGGTPETFGPPLGRSPAVGDASTLDAYKLNDKAARALSQFGAVYLDDSADNPEPHTLQVGGRTIDLVTVHVDALGILPRILITPALAADLQLSTTPGPVILRAAHELTNTERDLVTEIRDDYDSFGKPTTDGPFVNTGIAIISGSDNPPAFVLEALLSGIALVFALFVVAASLALAAAETRDERDALAVIGAAPSTMRRTSAHEAVLLAIFGAALAIPGGFLPVIVFTAADRSSTPFLVFPWRTVAMLLVVVPVLIGLFTSGASTLALRLRPVRVSTMTFD